MALAIPKKKKIIRILIIILNLLDDAFDNNADASLYEDVFTIVQGAQNCFWNSDENNWTNEESQAWAAVEALHEALVNQQGDEKIADMAQQLDTALNAI